MSTKPEHECALCISQEVEKCKCGGYYCKHHMIFHKDVYCKFTGKRREKNEKDTL